MVVVPNRRRVQLKAECHDAEHRSAAHTHDQISQAGFWWPGANQDVKEYVKSCLVCRAYAAGNQGKGLWVGWGVEPRRFSCEHMDFAGPLTVTGQGNRYLLSIFDRAHGRENPGRCPGLVELVDQSVRCATEGGSGQRNSRNQCGVCRGCGAAGFQDTVYHYLPSPGEWDGREEVS